jgi:Na+/melibiose symporter-like transporter
MEDPRAATFPRVVIVVMGILSVALLLQSAIVRQKMNRPVLQSTSVKNKSEKNDAAAKNAFPFLRVFLCFILIIIYFAVMEWLGFYFSAFLFFVAATFVLGRKELTLRKGGVSVGIAFIFTAVLFVLFNKLLVVQTPKGIFF